MAVASLRFHGLGQLNALHATQGRQQRHVQTRPLGSDTVTFSGSTNEFVQKLRETNKLLNELTLRNSKRDPRLKQGADNAFEQRVLAFNQALGQLKQLNQTGNKVVLTLNKGNQLAGRKGSLTPLKGLDLSGVFLTTKDGQPVDLSYTNLDHVSLNGSDFKGASFNGSRFFRAHMQHSNFQNADFSWTYFDGADMWDSNFNNAKFHHAEIYSHADHCTSFTRSQLVGAEFNDAIMTDVCMTDANLSSARFDNARLTGVGMAGSDVWDIHLENADMVDVYLKNAKNLTPRESVSWPEQMAFLYQDGVDLQESISYRGGLLFNTRGGRHSAHQTSTQ